MVYPHPLRVATGGLIEAVNMLVDITDRKKAETALRESEAFVCVTSVVGQTRSSLKVLIASSRKPGFRRSWAFIAKPTRGLVNMLVRRRGDFFRLTLSAGQGL